MRTTRGVVLLAVALSLIGSGCASGTGAGTPAAPASPWPAPPGTLTPPTPVKPSAVASASPSAKDTTTSGPAGAKSAATAVAGSTPGDAQTLRTEFDRFSHADTLSIAVVGVGSADEPIRLGEQGTTPVAWSTSKVPVAIAVERTDRAESLRPTMRRAITASDNEAAETLWQSLGAGDAAGRATDRVLRDFGDPTTTMQTRQVRPPYTAFGQTRWAVADQARFAAQLPCRAEAEPVYAAMGQVVADQRWGLGRVDGAHFKGGWGPSSRGYLVRQLGVIETSRGRVAVALSVDTGSFGDGTAALSRAAQWLEDQAAHLPAGGC